MKSVAFIPARSGSKRVVDKNIKLLNGHPLMAYSIRSAIESGIFDSVICATDNKLYAEIAIHYGAEVPFLRDSKISGDTSPDIEWVYFFLEKLRSHGLVFDIFSILRPTSPFRLPLTINKAWDQFINNPSADSLRAIEKCSQHPGKMWVIRNNHLLPILPFLAFETPWHSSQYSSLPEVFVQNASLEIAWSRLVFDLKTISGEVIIPFISENLEGFDINTSQDWLLAEHYISNGLAKLPQIKTVPFFSILN